MAHRKLATSLTIGSFFIALVSGLLIFFELGTGAVRATHEWTSIAFAMAAIFHVVVHRRPFFKYFKERTILYIGLACALGGLLFYQSRNDVYAAEAAYQTIIHSEIAALSPLLARSPADLLEELRGMGLTVSNGSQSVAELAAQHDRDVHDIIEPLLAQ